MNCPKCKKQMTFEETPPKPDNPTDYEKYYCYWGSFYECKECGIIIKTSWFFPECDVK